MFDQIALSRTSYSSMPLGEVSISPNGRDSLFYWFSRDEDFPLAFEEFQINVIAYLSDGHFVIAVYLGICRSMEHLMQQKVF